MRVVPIPQPIILAGSRQLERGVRSGVDCAPLVVEFTSSPTSGRARRRRAAIGPPAERSMTRNRKRTSAAVNFLALTAVAILGTNSARAADAFAEVHKEIAVRYDDAGKLLRE